MRMMRVYRAAESRVSARRMASAATADSARMPTARSLGFDMKYEACGENDSTKKVAVVCGWMGAKSRQLRVYKEFYHARGYDTLSFACGPQHVLMPSYAMKVMQKVVKEINSGDGDRDVIFHHFSMGGYLFGQMLRHLQTLEGKKGKEFQKAIIGQVFDSPPDFRSIAKGVSQSMGVPASSPVAVAVEMAMRLYLFVSSTTAGVEHRAASAAFHTNYISAPSLWFYSRSDPVALSEDCEKVISTWRKQGTSVEEVVWDDTPHIQHARIDPERYFGALDKFLAKHERETGAECEDTHTKHHTTKQRAKAT